MSSRTREPGPGIWEALTTRAASSRLLLPALVLLLPVVAAFLISGGQLEGWDWAWALAGFAIWLSAVGLQVMREAGISARERAAMTEADRLRVAMKDALQPVAELIADMPAKAKDQREAALLAVATQAVGALNLLLKDVERLRAVVYGLDEAGMTCLAYAGRGDRPQPFLRGTERGDLAMQLVETGGDRFEPDTRKASREGYAGSGDDYQSYISASISTSELGFGMVTVDAPRAGDLVDTDRQIVLLVADLLAIAFAEADRT